MLAMIVVPSYSPFEAGGHLPSRGGVRQIPLRLGGHRRGAEHRRDLDAGDDHQHDGGDRRAPGASGPAAAPMPIACAASSGTM